MCPSLSSADKSKLPRSEDFGPYQPPNFTIYSCVFDAFETAWEPTRYCTIREPILITDSKVSRKGWKVEYEDDPQYDDPRLANRNKKMLYFTTLDPNGISLYCDANVRVINSISPLLEAFEKSRADIGMYRHYARSSVREEAAACLARNKVDNPEALEEELALYASSGFPDDQGMWEGSVIFRRHSSQRLAEAMGEWWDLYSRFQTRDQFSLPFVIWKHGLEVFDLDEHSPGREHYFVRLQHSEAGVKNRMARYLQARAPENQMWGALHRLLSRLNPR